MNRHALLLVSHGSTDPRAIAVSEQVATMVRELLSDVPVRAAYLRHTSPSPAEALIELADAGVTDVVTVPFLLGAAHHVAVDLPGAVAAAIAARPALVVRAAAHLGAHPLVAQAILDRLAEAEVRGPGAAAHPDLARTLDECSPMASRDVIGETSYGSPAGHPSPEAVLLVSGGTAGGVTGSAELGTAASQAERNEFAELASLLSAQSGWRVVLSYAAAGSPTPGEALAALAEEGLRRIAVVPYLLAPGQLAASIAAAAAAAAAGGLDITISDVLGTHPALVELVALRYRQAQDS